MPMVPFLALWPRSPAAPPGSSPSRREQGRGRRRPPPSRPPPRAAKEEPIQHRAADRPDPARARLRPAQPHQRRPRHAPHRPDPGAAPAARRRDGLHHAVGAHPGQSAAARQRLRHPHQGDRGRARRTAPEHAAGHGSARRADRPARRGDDRADLRPAGAMGRRRPSARRRRSAATPWSSRRPSSPRI